MVKKKVLAISICGVLLSGIIGLVIARVVEPLPDFTRLSDEETIAYLESGKAKKLDREHLLHLGERLERIQSDTGLMRREMENASEEERRNLRESRRLVSEAVWNKRIDDFFALPPEKQNEFLDREIARMEERVTQFGERRPSPVSETDLSSRGRQRDPSARLQWRRNMLSRTTPEERAKRREYFRRLMERRAQIRRRFRRP